MHSSQSFALLEKEKGAGWGPRAAPNQHLFPFRATCLQGVRKRKLKNPGIDENMIE